MDNDTQALLLRILSDLPSTGLFVLFIWLWDRQVKSVLEMAGRLLEQVNEIMAECMRQRSE